ncbi:sensor histidine kinase [Oricola cellulosilytica]|uniref:histidine kinase n=1 Tax=Oricola cellulosilytica TaxID=1429082 RepID=A0A4R0PEA7_9HYPH|nr:sensor histidine kinase [Oricola cellulosilytica]TCD16126.1 sensor histidine kinase [Oricola cellulosilytica]
MAETVAHVSRPARRPSLALRLTIAVSLILLLAVTAALYSAWNYGLQAANEAYDRLLTGASLQIAERVAVIDGELVVDLPSSAFELLSLARNDRIFYRVIGTDGETLTGYPDLPPPSGREADAMVYEIEYSGETVRAVMTTRPVAERTLSGQVSVVVAHTIHERMALARDIATKAAILVGAAALAIVLLAYVAVRYALAPLTRVERALLSRDPNDLSPFDIETPREIETVVDAINRFTRRLDRRIGSVQSFVADAAHQLRTPITAIRAQAQLAAGETSPDRLRRINRRILDRSVAVSRLADQLLSHAMITHRTDAEPRESVDLRRVAMEAEQETRSLAEESRAAPVLDLPEEPVIVTGDRFSLREAVKNLVNNAYEHGSPPIVIRVGAHPGEASIAVADRGKGIPPAERGSAGTRFRGKRPARGKGAGLGLAIAHEVAVSHGGRLHMRDTEDDGFEIGLRLPQTEEGTP